MRFPASIAFVLMIALPTMAGRPVTEAERARLLAAMAPQNCSGGDMEWDDGHFETRPCAAMGGGMT